MSVIKIKRSGASGSPSSLGQGELAYSYLAGTEINGGDRLYIGTGTETGGNAANIEVIGGKYFTEKLDHTPGTLIANSAIVVDSNSKIDVLNVDNITIDGSTISSNTSITIDSNGAISVSSSVITDLGTPTANTDAATKLYVDQQVGSVVSNFNIDGDSGSDVFETGQTLTFTGDTGITTTVSNNEVAIDLDDTAVTPGSYGNTTAIPVFTVDGQGRLTAANTVSISTDLSITGDSGSDTISLSTETLDFVGGAGITTTVSGNTVTIAADDATTSTKGIASFSNTNFTVTSGEVTSKDITIGSNTVTLGGTLTTIAGLTQIDVGDLRYNDNVISATDVNGSITLSPNGSGFVSVDSSLIKNVSDPVEPGDAANKRYVDEVAQGLQIKGSVEAATVADLNGTYDNGNNGIGSTITLANTATLDIDGWTSWSEFDGILVKDQTNAEENGRYFVSTVGNTSTDWVLTRCTACDEKEEIIGAYVFVSHGTTYEATGWVATVANTDSFTVGTSDIDWIQFSGAGTYEAGTGLVLTGTIFSANAEYIQDTVGNILVEGEGINLLYDDANNEITVAAELATTSNLGVASFDATNFDVSGGGEVTIDTIDGGTY